MPTLGNNVVIEVSIRQTLTNSQQVLAATGSVEELLGYSPEELLSARVSIRDRIHRDDRDIADTLFSPTAAEGPGVTNLRFRQANGQIRCLKVLYRKESTADGVVLDLVLQDARSLTQAGPACNMMVNLAAMMENTDDFIYFKDRNHVFTGASQTLVSLCRSAEHWSDLIGQTDYELFPEDYADIYYRLEKEVFAGKLIAQEVQEYLTKDGKKGWVDNRKYPIRNEAGEIVGLYGIARDITEQRVSEELLRRQAEILIRYRDYQEEQGRLAKDIIEHVSHQHRVDDNRVSYWLEPAKIFSGDVVATACSADDKLYVLLADATGHGLASAICTMPILPLFYRMVDNGQSLEKIVMETNSALMQSMPQERFVAANFAVFDRALREVQIWQCGMPNILHVDGNGKIKARYESSDLPLGIARLDSGDLSIRRIAYQPGDQIVMYSDGLTDALNSSEEMFGITGLERAIENSSPDERLNGIKDAVIQHIAGAEPRDDIALVVVSC